MNNLQRHMIRVLHNTQGPPKQKVNMVAIITKGQRILSIGFNDFQRKSFQKKSQYKITQGMHAELAAIIKWKNKVRGATLTVFGATRGGNVLKNTKPCKSCWDIIVVAGIRKVTYMKDNRWTTQKVHKMA